MFTLWEAIQIAVTILAVGFIFFEIRPQAAEDLLNPNRKWRDLKFAVAITAPAIIFHELAHKFLALGYGLDALYYASWWGLGIGVFLKLLAPGFIFFIPGYVSVAGLGTHLQFALISLAGPLTNLILLAFFSLAIKKDVMPKYRMVWLLSRRINLWLFAFNMLPIPGIDGFNFYANLYRAFTG